MDDLAMTVDDQRTVNAMWKGHLRQQRRAIRKARIKERKARMPGLILSSVLFTIGAINMGAGLSLILQQSNTGDGLHLAAFGIAAALLAVLTNCFITRRRFKPVES
ncbi:MAG: hypothetical protein ABF453_01925 [Bifidobacterium psychraerophilum]|uniref:hypothetical protein n=1 Tax=Bifidobacterium psychraerophilum TaxID=218140 RepID=UPI0039EB09E1